MNEVFCKQIVYGSEEHKETVILRQAILRTPLGLMLDPEDLRKEEDDFHIAAFCDGKLAGCLILAPQSPVLLKMRQVAVADEMRGRGVGKKMVLWAEEFSRARGFCFIMMHARETARVFYEKIGYTTSGTRFTEVTVPTWKMEKKLT